MTWCLSDDGFYLDGTRVAPGDFCRRRDSAEKVRMVLLTDVGVVLQPEAGECVSKSFKEFGQNYVFHCAAVSRVDVDWRGNRTTVFATFAS